MAAGQAGAERRPQIVDELVNRLGESYRKIRNTIRFMLGNLGDFDPETNANYRFLDELFDEQYIQEERLGTMIKVFTTIAIFINGIMQGIVDDIIQHAF